LRVFDMATLDPVSCCKVYSFSCSFFEGSASSRPLTRDGEGLPL